MPGVPEDLDGFGAALAAGLVNADARADLAVGVPGENSGGGDPFVGEGAVNLLLGSPAGLSGAGSQIWSQRSAGVEGLPGQDDQFGAALAMAPLDNGPSADLAIGAPGDSIGSIAGAGSVTVLLSDGSGLAAPAQRLHQDTPEIDGAAEPGDGFGLSVAAAYVQTPDQASLIIGAPLETVHGVAAGQIHQLATFEFGPSPDDSRTFHLDTAGVKGVPGDGALLAQASAELAGGSSVDWAESQR